MINKILEKVTEIIRPHPVYAVGGCVRDYLMGNEPKDFDFCTPIEPDEIEKLVINSKLTTGKAYTVGKRFGTIGCKIEIDGKFHLIEITTFRSEKYKPGSRKPEVEYVKHLHEDLSRRDFTINAIAIRLTKGHLRIIDPFLGQEDIESSVIRTVGSSKTRFKEDPLRMLRAIRFSCRFNFRIDTETYKKIKKMSIYILDISKERWMMELDKILQNERAKYGILYLWECNLFKYIIPELDLQYLYEQNSQYHSYCLHEHTSRVVEAVRKDTDDLNLLWAGLLHDIAKPFVRTDKTWYEKPIEEMDEHSGDLVACGVKSNYIGHEVLGAEMVDRIALHLKWSKERREKVVEIVRNHLKEDSPLRKYDNEGKK